MPTTVIVRERLRLGGRETEAMRVKQTRYVSASSKPWRPLCLISFAVSGAWVWAIAVGTAD